MTRCIAQADLNRRSPEPRRRMRALLSLVLLAFGTAHADAGRGELAGHRLGERVALDLVSAPKIQADGSLRISAAGAGNEFDAVYLYTSPGSGEVGKIALSRRLAEPLQAKRVADEIASDIEARYAQWERLKAPLPLGRSGGEMLSRLQQGKYALIVYYRPLEQAGYEVVLELEYASRAPQRKAWRDLVAAEREAMPAG